MKHSAIRRAQLVDDIATLEKEPKCKMAAEVLRRKLVNMDFRETKIYRGKSRYWTNHELSFSIGEIVTTSDLKKHMKKKKRKKRKCPKSRALKR